MRVTIKKWGNSASVRIPASLMKAARLHLDEAVEIHEHDGTIIIKPIRAVRYQLSDLLAEISPANMHAAVDVGKPVGREML